MARQRSPRSLTACANVKVTDEELQAIRARASAQGLTVSEWGRLRVSVRASAALMKDVLSRGPSSGREVFDLLHGTVSQAW